MPISRETLYAEIWAEPMTTVAARYGVSSNYLARVCERLKIPRPARGYWAQRAAGEDLALPELPEASPGDEIEWSRNGYARREPLPRPEAPDGRQAQEPRDPALRPGRHPLIQAAKEELEAAPEHRDGYLRPAKLALADLVVSKACLRRGLRLANELFLSLEDHHHRVELAPRGVNLWRRGLDARDEARGYSTSDGCAPSRMTVVFIGTVAIGLTIYEERETVEVRYTDGGFVRVSDDDRKRTKRAGLAREWTTTRELPSGRLGVRATSPYPNTKWEERWVESEGKKLIAQVPEIVEALEAAAPRVARLAAEAEREYQMELERHEAEHQRWLEAEAARTRAEEVRRRDEALASSRDQLVAVAGAWQDALRVDAFLDEVVRRAGELEDAERDRVLERVRLAKLLMGGVDALARFGDWEPPEMPTRGDGAIAAKGSFRTLGS